MLVRLALISIIALVVSDRPQHSSVLAFSKHSSSASSSVFSSEEEPYYHEEVEGNAAKEEYTDLYYYGTEPGEGRETDYSYKSVCIVEGQPAVINGFDCREQVALGRFKNSINLTGWSYLEVETFSSPSGKERWSTDMQAYAAGVLEGLLSRQVIAYSLANTYNDYCVGFTGYCRRLTAYMREHLAYVREKVEKAHADDPYWQSVRRSYLQMTGVWDAYRGAIKEGLSGDSGFNLSISYELHPIMMINSMGEFYDLEKKFNKSRDPNAPLTPEGHCSGLVKLAPNNADLFISQVTMSGLQNLLRVLKLYKFGYDYKLFPGHTVTFSSYPGMLYSSDDFALMSSGLAAIETTVSLFNRSLFDEIKPREQLHCWVRAIAANQLARTAREWCRVFARHNSGTYNNQWVVVDYNKFTPYQPLPSYGLLYVLEQLPGTIAYRDLTFYLKRESYFASYNIPFFKRISRLSGFDQQAQKLYWYSWHDCPRAKIFARDHNTVVDLGSLTRLMRYNDYKHEEYSRCDCKPPYTAEAAISARGDLNPANGTYPLPGMGHVNHAALDYKGTNHRLVRQLRFRAWSGPTYDNVPAFRWSDSDLAATVKHYGHPDLWQFHWEDYKWETEMP